MSDKEYIVLYHANCPDGFGSAWSFWNKYGDAAEYIAVRHGGPPPDVSGKSVFIVDFSYPRDVLLSMNEEASSLVVIDHHISAQKELSDLEFCNFDMNHSGAYLSWAYLFGDKNVPNLILYIEDRDLWKWELKYSKEILSAVDSYDKTFENWDTLNEWLENGLSDSFQQLLYRGEGILKYKDTLIESLLKNSYVKNIAGFKVPIVNSPFFQSEMGSILSKGEKFAAAYYYDGDGYCFSLRSDENGEDVSKIAKAFGGGGHKRASGFKSFLRNKHFPHRS